MLHFSFFKSYNFKSFYKKALYFVHMQYSLTCTLYRGCFGALTSLSRWWAMSLNSKSLQTSWGCRSSATDLEDLDMLCNPWINVPRLIFAKAMAILIFDVFCMGSLLWKISLWKVTDVGLSRELLTFTLGRDDIPHNCLWVWSHAYTQCLIIISHPLQNSWPRHVFEIFIWICEFFLRITIQNLSYYCKHMNFSFFSLC